MLRIANSLIVTFVAALLFVVPPAALARDTKVDNPAIWKIDGPKGDVYLFGSVHLLPQGVNWRTPALDAALNAAQAVAFEIDLDKAKDPIASQSLVVKLGMLPQGTTLRKLLSPERRTKYERVAKSVGLVPLMLDQMRPWLAAVTISVQWIVSKGYDPNSGVDQHIWTWAKANNKERLALETIEEQLNVFAGLTLEQEVEYLVISTDQIENSPDMLDGMINAWRKGDVKVLDKVLNDGMKEFPVLNQRLLADRHAKWLPQIERMLADGRTFVVVVGAAHLTGKGSVVDLLRQKGIKVEGP
jgi:uncharacterized protein YbaP (TraB family)